MSNIDPNQWRRDAGIPTADDQAETKIVSTGLEDYNSEEGRRLLDASRNPLSYGFETPPAPNVRGAVPEVDPSAYTGEVHESSKVDFLNPKNIRGGGGTRATSVIVWSIILSVVLTVLTPVPAPFLWTAVPLCLISAHRSIPLRARAIIMGGSATLFLLFLLVSLL